MGLSSSGTYAERWLEEQSMQRPTETGVELGESDFFTLICPFPSWPERLLVSSFGLILFPTHFIDHLVSFPRWLSGKESACQCRRCRFDPWVGKIPWRRKWQPTPVFLPIKSHGQRSLEGYSPRDHKRVTTEHST